ncbi:MAG: glycerol-3-phosphate dehydrogenase [Rhodobacteraceae bacterium]|nr:glycerol-3-phosphate dehydrogenase [Paracoccaceae bacterium]MBR28119.1 glycerol-3-phosphate dehydrogenase [Paracoccaceae bacterium]
MSAFDLGADDPAAPPPPIRRIAVIGAGAWGTALACVAAHARRGVTLWSRREDHAAALRADGRNLKYLPDVPLPDSIRVTSDLAAALENADAVLLVVPSSAIRETARAMAEILPKTTPVILCAKGIEPGSGLLMSDVASEELKGNPMGALSGPNFAAEAALGHPTACTIASDDGVDKFEIAPERTVAARLAVAMGTESFRPYVSDDLPGVEVGGALKNVIAIACGIATGAGFGANTRAALITRGLDEMKRLAEPLGGRRETVTGLAGIGDLTLTCSSEKSRNMSFGLQLGSGIARDKVFDGKPVVVEGERNALSVTDLARKHDVHLPICEAVRGILHDGHDVSDAFAMLWGRPLEGEPRALVELELGHPAERRTAFHFKEMLS